MAAIEEFHRRASAGEFSQVNKVPARREAGLGADGLAGVKITKNSLNLMAKAAMKFFIFDLPCSFFLPQLRKQKRTCIMKTQLITNPIEVINRLDSLFGWKREELTEVVERMVAGRNSCTDNDPPSAPGWMSWCFGTRRLREMGALKGWDRNNDDQIASIYDRKRGIKIAVCNTDEGTGMEAIQPQNRAKKGAATDRAVFTNQVLFNTILNEAENNVIQLSDDISGVAYWYLCVYSEGDIIRAELSCPSECENGFFKTFRERIILIGGDSDDGGVRVRRESPDGDSGFEINVTRKQAQV